MVCSRGTISFVYVQRRAAVATAWSFSGFTIFEFLPIAFANVFLIALYCKQYNRCCKEKALSRVKISVWWRNACLEFEFGTSTRCRCHRNDVNPDGNSTHLGKVLWSSPICVQISVLLEKKVNEVMWFRGMKTTWTFHLFVCSIAMCFLVYIWMHPRVLFLPIVVIVGLQIRYDLL